VVEVRKRISAIFLALLSTIIFSTIAGATAKKSTHHIGLHDRLLTFKEGDVRVVNNKMMVPLSDIAKYLYIDTKKENNQMLIQKNGIEIAYDYGSEKTFKDGVTLCWSPIVDADGKLFIRVKYIAWQFGFQVEYFEKQKTLRIYRDTYKSMSHADFEEFIKKQLSTVETSKPTVKANVYLTFDDGPNPKTTTNAATLKKYGIHGTFFFLGSQMNYYPEIVKATHKDGHYVGSHSMTHVRKDIYKSAQSFINEMDGAVNQLNQITGDHSKLLRVPYGSKPNVTIAMKDRLIKNGYKMWDWDVDSNDWRYTTNQSAEIVKNVRIGVNQSYQSGDRDIIVLLHDRPQTAKALPQIIEWLQKEGYTIKKYDPAHHIVQNFHHDPAL